MFAICDVAAIVSHIQRRIRFAVFAISVSEFALLISGLTCIA
jgi:hypothetical protein